MSTGFDDAPSFSTKLRGFDPTQVNDYVTSQSARITELIHEKDALLARLEQMGETSIDFNSFADELRLILEAAHQAADTLRNRATSEVAAWRDSAHKEVEQSRREASEASENLRRDAWIAAETLIEQAQDESKAALETAARESLAVVGKAERDAHRIQSNARRESEELMRLARMESERTLVDARGRHDEIVEQARTQADAAQERARSLEVRRAELLTELDSVQVAVARLEDDLNRKREELEAAPPAPAFVDSSVKVVAPPENPAAKWDSEGIKLIPAQKRVEPPASAPIDAAEMAEEVRQLKAAPPPAVVPEGEFSIIKIIPAKHEDEDADDAAAASGESAEGDGPDDDAAGDGSVDAPVNAAVEEAGLAESSEATVETPMVAADTESAEEDDSMVAGGDDALGGLFAALRETAETPIIKTSKPELATEAASGTSGPEADQPAEVKQPVVVAIPAKAVEAPADVLELRDHLLLPIMNRVLRDIKRQLTEAQNIALEQLRVAEDEWAPDVDELTERVHGDLTIVAQESFAAGYEAVESMTGQNAGRPKSRKADIPNVSGEFAEAIAADLVTAAAKGDGPRAAASAVSRAYRAWRTDTAERRVRAIALAAYHRGIARALAGTDATAMVWAVAGRGCVECRTIAEAGPVSPEAGFAGGIVPPLHKDCSCTVVVGA